VDVNEEVDNRSRWNAKS